MSQIDTLSFNLIFNNENVKSVPFDQNWYPPLENDTDINDKPIFAANAKVEINKVVKSQCDITKQRLLMLGTIFGAIVVFETVSDAGHVRYHFKTSSSTLIIVMAQFGATKYVNSDDMSLIFGSPEGRSNFGAIISHLQLKK